jgi:hypothetical protein
VESLNVKNSSNIMTPTISSEYASLGMFAQRQEGTHCGVIAFNNMCGSEVLKISVVQKYLPEIHANGAKSIVGNNPDYTPAGNYTTICMNHMLRAFVDRTCMLVHAVGNQHADGIPMGQDELLACFPNDVHSIFMLTKKYGHIEHCVALRLHHPTGIWYLIDSLDVAAGAPPVALCRDEDWKGLKGDFYFVADLDPYEHGEFGYISKEARTKWFPVDKTELPATPVQFLRGSDVPLFWVPTQESPILRPYVSSDSGGVNAAPSGLAVPTPQKREAPLKRKFSDGKSSAGVLVDGSCFNRNQTCAATADGGAEEVHCNEGSAMPSTSAAKKN